MIKLYPFQETGRDFLASRTAAMLLDEMGLGKTPQAIEALKLIRARNGIILCPMAVRPTWRKVLRSQHPTAVINEMMSSKSVVIPTAFNIINYDLIWKENIIRQFKQFNWDVLICDEAHYLKNIETNRSKVTLGRGGLIGRCAFKWMLSGTPMENRPIELFPLLRAVAPDAMGKYKDYYAYAYRFCGGYQGPFGFVATGAANLKELSALLKPVMLRRLKKDVAPELPKVTIQKVYLESSEKLHSILRKELQASVEESKSLHRALGIVKSAAAEKLIEDDLEGGVEKIVVYTYHKDVAKALKDKFGAKAVLYTGEETITEKEEAKRLFVEDARVRIFIGQITAAGTGLDGLQAVCSTAVFVELVYAPERIRQAIGRLDRFGQTQPVTVKVLIAEDSEDEKFLDTLALKAGHIAQVYDEVGDVRFLGACCAVCNEKKELKDLRRVAGLSVCKDARCVETLEALI